MLNNKLNIVKFDKLTEFLKNGTHNHSPSNVDLHILSGWQMSTLKSYNWAVSKYVKFARISGHLDFKLPVSSQDIKNFCLRVGRSMFGKDLDKISSASIKKYLAGLRAWHTFHNVTFPTVNNSRINLMLKASAKEDELVGKRPKKLPIMLWHVVHLWKEISRCKTQKWL
jgi:hypothetical protein